MPRFGKLCLILYGFNEFASGSSGKLIIRELRLKIKISASKIIA
jgi:hypothetical protein